MQMKTSVLLIISTLCTAQHSWGNTTPEQDQKRFLQTGQQQWLRQLENHEQMPATADGQQAAPVLTQQDLLARPQLLARMLVQVLNGPPQPELLADLTSLYAQTPQPNTVLLRRAQGMQAKYAGDYARAVQIYRELAAEEPQDVRIRLDLAAMLAEDKQWRESAQLFKTVQSEPEVPAEVQNNVQHYLNHIAKQQQWQWSGGL